MDRVTRNRAILNIDGERKIYVRPEHEEDGAMQEGNQVGDVSTGMEPNDESTDHEISIGMNNMTINNGNCCKMFFYILNRYSLSIIFT